MFLLLLSTVFTQNLILVSELLKYFLTVMNKSLASNTTNDFIEQLNVSSEAI